MFVAGRSFRQSIQRRRVVDAPVSEDESKPQLGSDEFGSIGGEAEKIWPGSMPSAGRLNLSSIRPAKTTYISLTDFA